MYEQDTIRRRYRRRTTKVLTEVVGVHRLYIEEVSSDDPLTSPSYNWMYDVEVEGAVQRHCLAWNRCLTWAEAVAEASDQAEKTAREGSEAAAWRAIAKKIRAL